MSALSTSPTPPTPSTSPPPSPSSLPLSSLLTVIITTSPIRSNPSLTLLESIIATFPYAAPLQTCSKIIVCDGYKKKDAQEGKHVKYANEKSQMRSGIVDDAQEGNYAEYKKQLKQRCVDDADDQALPFHNTRILDLPTRHGYGFALKASLSLVETPYVIVIQHDRNFMRSTPVEEAVRVMEVDPTVKYVGMCMRSNLMYLEQFVGKYGRPMLDDLDREVKRPRELELEGGKYGGSEAAEGVFRDYHRVRDKYRLIRDNYRVSVPYVKYVRDNDGRNDGRCQASLIPTVFWYDNVHVCRTEHYRNWVFDAGRKLVKRGGFVEDKLSPRIVEDVRREGFREGWGKYGCYLLDDHAGVAFTGHMDGGAWMTEDMRRERKGGWLEQNEGKAKKEEKEEGLEK